MTCSISPCAIAWTGSEQDSERKGDGDGDRGGAHVEDERLQADPAELLHVAQPGDAADQRHEDQGDDQHLQRRDEDRAHDLEQSVHEIRLDEGNAGQEEVYEHAERRAQNHPDHDLHR
jgi:hypothetical protein